MGSHLPTVLLALGVLVVAFGFLGGATTYSLLADTEVGAVSVSAASTFDDTPPGPRAYDDQNGNDRWDSGEPTFTESQLYNFNDQQADLVVPSDVGTVNRSSGVSITAGSITARTDFQSGSASVRLDATDGNADVQNQQFVAAREVSVSSTATTNIDGTAMVGVVDGVSISGKSVSAQGASLGSFRTVTVSARERGGGSFDLSGASLTSVYSDIRLESSGDMNLQNAALSARYGEITADLRRGGQTLDVRGTSIDDQDNTLIYSPQGTNVQGTPSSGSVSSGSGPGGQALSGGPITGSQPTNATSETDSSGASEPTTRPSPEEVLEPPVDWQAIAERLNVPIESLR